MTNGRATEKTRDRQCPFCLTLLSADRQGSADHLFGRAFGGTATVRACKDCNQKLGSEVEGPLQWNTSLMNLIKVQLHKVQAVEGTLPNGAPGSLNLITGEVRTRHLVEETEDARYYTGSERQLRQALSKKFPPSEVQRLISAAQPVSLGGEWFQTTLEIDMRLWGRMVAKMALAAGCRVAPHLFTSEAAAHLRDVCWGKAAPIGNPLMVAGYERQTARWTQMVSDHPGATNLTPFPDGSHGQMLFVSAVPGLLSCIPKVAGREFWGIVVEWPGEQWSSEGVLVTDTGDGEVAVRDLAQDLMRCKGQ